MPEHFTVQDPAPDDAASTLANEDPTGQTPAQDAIVEKVTDDAALVAHEVAQAPTPDDLIKVTQGADNGVVGVVLALIAVVGGGAAWRFYSQHSKQKADLAAKQAEQAHELAMRRLEVEASVPSTCPQSCIVEHSRLEARIAACEAKTSSVSSIGLPAGFNADEVIERIEKLEKANKPKPAPRKR